MVSSDAPPSRISVSPHLDVLEELGALVEERLFQLIQARHGLQSSRRSSTAYGATLRMVAIRRSGSNGFTIQPVAPASRAIARLSVSLSVVSTRIGVRLWIGSLRRFRITS